MSERKRRRATALLKIRQRQEQLALRAFEQARSRAEAVRRRVADLARAMRAQNEAARKDLAVGRAPTVAAYRDNVACLRAAVAERLAQLGRADEALQRCREELIEAMTRRKAVALRLDRLEGEGRARRRRAEADRLDDVNVAGPARRGGTGRDDQPAGDGRP